MLCCFSYKGAGVTVESVRRFCTALPHATETVQWGSDLVFKIGGKMFAVVALEPSRVWLSFKATRSSLQSLRNGRGLFRPRIWRVPTGWRWKVKKFFGVAELKRLLRQAYDLVIAGLPKKAQAALKA